MDIKPRVSNSSPVATTNAAVADSSLVCRYPSSTKFGQWGLNMDDLFEMDHGLESIGCE